MDMKKVVVLLCVALIGAGTFAFTFMGPPTAELKAVTGQKEGNYREDRHGYIFSYSEMDIGVGLSALLGPVSGTLEDVEIYRHYYNWGIALDENFNFNVLLGTASADWGGTPGVATSFDGDYDFSFGFNLKSTFHHDKTIDWGAMFQMTWLSTEDIVTFSGVGPATFELDNVYDLQVAIGPTVDMGGWDLYGGAFYYMLEGDLDVSAFGVDIASLAIDEEDQLGGFVGAKFDIMKDTDLIVEYSMGSDSYGLGLSIGRRF